MKSIMTFVGVLAGALAAAPSLAQTKPASPAATDVYHVHFTKAAPGQAAELGKEGGNN